MFTGGSVTAVFPRGGMAMAGCLTSLLCRRTPTEGLGQLTTPTDRGAPQTLNPTSPLGEATEVTGLTTGSPPTATHIITTADHTSSPGRPSPDTTIHSGTLSTSPVPPTSTSTNSNHSHSHRPNRSCTQAARPPSSSRPLKDPTTPCPPPLVPGSTSCTRYATTM